MEFTRSIVSKLSDYEKVQTVIFGFTDSFSALIRRTVHLARMNIVYLNGMLTPPLNTLASRIPRHLWPLLGNLPGSKLEPIKSTIKTFISQHFGYLEKQYSSLWFKILLILFRHDMVLVEFSLRNLEPDYKENFIDYVIAMGPSYLATFLYIELSRDHLSSIHSHKDEHKIAEAMGAGLLKNMSLMKHRGVETLKKLRVYGLLGGATDFELCKIYAVFPNENNIDDFYMVFDSSSTKLRFKLLDSNRFTEIFTEESDDFETLPASTEYGFEDRDCPANAPTFNVETYEILFDRKEELECRRLIAHGYINDKAIRVLERLAELVEIQRQLFEGVDARYADPKIRFAPNQVNIMTSGRTKHTVSSNAEIGFLKSGGYEDENSCGFGSDVDVMNDLIMIINDSPEKENILGENTNNESLSSKLFPSDDASKEGIAIKKPMSSYAMQIYKAVHLLPFFPKTFAEEGGRCKLIMEKLTTLSKEFDYSRFDASTANIFCLKLLVDLFGAIRSLHQLGYVHGNVTPANVGYNQRTGVFQLFDFNNSRTISEAKAGNDDRYVGTENFASRRYEDTGIYDTFDDYVGILKTCYYCSKQIPGEYDFLKDKDFRVLIGPFIDNDDRTSVSDITLTKHYIELVKLYLEKTGKNSDDPTIKNVISLITKK